MSELTLADKEIFCDPDCAKCGGLGLLYIEAQGGYGKCTCHYREKLMAGVQRSGIPDKYRNCRVDDYSPQTPAEHALKAKAVAFVLGFETGARGLLIHGNVGNGKTHLSVGILTGVIKTRDGKPMVQPVFACVEEWLASIKADFNKETEQSHAFERACEAPLLCLDDFGAERHTPFSEGEINRLINARYNSQQTTIITTNLPVKEIKDRYGRRLFDRMQEMCEFMPADGPSRRSGKAAK